MNVNMKKPTILGLLVVMFAAGLFAGAIMFGSGEGPTAEVNVANAEPPPDPTIQAFARCFKASDGTFSTRSGPVNPIPKGGVGTSITASCPSGAQVTGGGYLVNPNDAKVRIAVNEPAGTIFWSVQATR